MRIAWAVVVMLAGGCHAAQPAPPPVQVNQAEDDALEADIRDGEVKRAVQSAKHSHLAGVDLFELRAFGIDPDWSFDIGAASLYENRRMRVGLVDETLGRELVHLDPHIAPVVRGGRATYRGKSPSGIAFQVTVTPADCHLDGDHTPLSAELRIGNTTRRGCAGSPYAMRNGWD